MPDKQDRQQTTILSTAATYINDVPSASVPTPYYDALDYYNATLPLHATTVSHQIGGGHLLTAAHDWLTVAPLNGICTRTMAR